jgi:hypothetical protein
MAQPVNPNQPGNQMQVKFTDEAIRGVYANLAQLAFSKEEFVIDFMNTFPPMATLNARVIMSPGHLKRLAGLLAQTVANYEKEHGAIEVAKQADGGIGFHTN